jgi:capsular polysaccharide biosynthesis protein
MQLDLRQIWNGIRKRWWLAFLVMLSAAAVAYLYTNAQPRIYQAQTTLVVKVVPPENGTIEAIKKNMSTYAQELGSKTLWRDVMDSNLIRTWNIDALSNQVKVQARPDQNALVMTVDNEDKDVAADVAKAISQAFVEQHNAENQALASGNKVVWVITQAAEPPPQPYQPRPLLYAGAAALFGLILGLLLVIGLELIDMTLKTPADIKQYTELNTLGIIPRSTKS